jgi:hypothetical protein
MAKNSLLAKICDGPMFHLVTTGNDDEMISITGYCFHLQQYESVLQQMWVFFPCCCGMRSTSVLILNLLWQAVVNAVMNLQVLVPRS